MNIIKLSIVIVSITFLILSIVPLAAAQQGEVKGVGVQSVEQNTDGGYMIKMGEMYAYYYGYMIRFHGSETEDYGQFEMSMKMLRVSGDIEGKGTMNYHCDLSQMTWEYKTGQEEGFLDGSADIDLEKTGSSPVRNTRAEEPKVGTGEQPENKDEAPIENQDGAPADNKEEPQNPNGTDKKPDETQTRLQSWARLTIRFMGVDSQGGLKFDIRLRLRENATGDLLLKIEQEMGGGGEKNQYQYKYMTKNGGNTDKEGHYQLTDGKKQVAGYSWTYKYNTSNGDGSQVQEKTMLKTVGEETGLAFEYKLKDGECEMVHDPTVYVDQKNIQAILDEAGDLIIEHKISILLGLVIGIVIIAAVSVVLTRSRKDRSDEQVDLEKNKYYKK